MDAEPPRTGGLAARWRRVIPACASSTTPSPGGPSDGIDLERCDVAEIEHHAPIGRAVAGAAVAAAAHGERKAALACEGDHPRDISCINRPGNDGRAPIDAAMENHPGLVIVEVIRRNDTTAQGVAQAVNEGRRRIVLQEVLLFGFHC